MAEFDPNSLAAVQLVPLTAFDAQGRINRQAQFEHIARMATAGIRVFLPAAGTSEYHSLSPDEIVDLVRITREAAVNHAVVFAPVGSQILLAQDVAQRAVQAGADGIMFMPLLHPYLCDAGARQYYHAVLKSAKCPALIYKAAAVPSDELLLELAEHPQVVGVKYAVNNLHDFRRVVLADGPRIEWSCGSAERFAPYFMLAGARGYTSGAGNICPRLTLAMHAALRAGHFSEAMQLQAKVLPIEDFRARDGESYSISMLKHAIAALGHDFGLPRPPQRQLTAAERAEIEQLVKPIHQADAQLAM